MAKTQKINADSILLEAALEGLEIKKRQIEDQIANIRGLLRNSSPAPTSEVKIPRRALSKEGRKRIAAAQKKRWADFRKRAS